MLNKNDEIVLEVQNAAFEGKSVARHEGLVVFVENAVPGDLVLARLLKIKKSYAEAQTIRIERPSKLRVEPRCKYFGVCGGCKWQHVDYNAQLQFKQQHVLDSFERIGGFKDLKILPIIGADDVYFYRGKMEFSFSEQEWTSIPPQKKEDVNPDSGIFLGLHVPQRYDKVLDTDECHLQSPLSNRILNFTRNFAKENNLDVYNSESETGYLRFLVIRESKRTKETMINLVTSKDDQDIMKKYTNCLLQDCPQVTAVVNTINSRKAQIAFGQSENVYYGSGLINEELSGKMFVISASSFFQTNVVQAERLYGVVKEFGEFKSTDTVFDLYSGTGSIAIFISDCVKEIIGIESAESSIRDAERNAGANNIINCRFLLGDLKDRLTKDKEWLSSCSKPDVIIIDPPRTGMHPKVVEEIVSLSPERIVYVSCNPATQARDAKLLCAETYRLIKLQPVDMFPHTYHIENVALLVKK
jgi:23S rRNA (uracil1939-C5)-methyltransferase